MPLCLPPGRLFPDWFGTHQNNLFTRPAELLINRKAVRNAVFSIVKSAPDVVYARSDGYVDNVRVRADFRFEYDGMMWVKLTLNGKGVLVKNLELHFPLRRAEGHLVHSIWGLSVGLELSKDHSPWLVRTSWVLPCGLGLLSI